ncbi:transporter substrate-binding domain-containing protein [Oricola sp.]|uniref:transporter substrate-binding domain-containing protein n=1 Tax=Oricola sp. TaxID=1979950 RepID=UPI0025FE0A31|nr:transporter substrate-binding domain-containing protein [Oricola sp.]MCI5078268.1 transporter substrate-binding domain-containing protein [Oricola sp.]
MTDELRRTFAPTEILRAALNHGNRVLVSRNASGQAEGITVDLARIVAERLELPLEFVHYERAIDVSSSATDGSWDICFLAVDPGRAEVIHFTDPYVRIEGNYLASPLCKMSDAVTLVRDGAKVGTVDGSAYTLHLKRQEGAENLVVYRDIVRALAAMDCGDVEAIAGISAAMEIEAATRPGARVLQPPFMAILQAMGTPKAHTAAGAWLTEFVAELARSGSIGEILDRHGVASDCAVVPQ